MTTVLPAPEPAVRRIHHADQRSGPTLANRSLAGALLLAGLAFAAYPVLRPYSSEVGMPGATAFASWRWTASHLSAVFGFIVLAQLSRRRDLGRVGPTVLGIGAMAVLPYYGAEVFGLGAIGRQAVARGDAASMSLVDPIRYGVPAVVLFAGGLVLLAWGGVAVARTMWRASARVGAVLVGSGLVLFLPQFWFPPELRMVHGLVLGLGLVLLARHLDLAGRRATR